MITGVKTSNGYVNLFMQQGTKNVFHVDVFTDTQETVEADLSGYSARSMFRANVGSISAFPALMEPVCTISGNRITCEISPSDSSSCPILSGVYDVEIYIAEEDPEETVHRVQQGLWTLDPEATIPAS